jgi:CrcB protein
VLLKILLIAAGGAFGSVLRYVLGGWIQGDARFPYGTLAVNVSGCLAIGFLVTLFTGPVLIREEYRSAVLIGILGGYTTFSSFGWDALGLATGGQLPLALLYVLLTNGLGLPAVWLGNRLAVAWFGVA